MYSTVLYKHARSVLSSETLPTQPSVRYARFQHWICSSGSTGEHNLSKNAARWNFQFDIGKQRRNTKVKNDPRSEFSNLSNWKEEA